MDAYQPNKKNIGLNEMRLNDNVRWNNDAWSVPEISVPEVTYRWIQTKEEIHVNTYIIDETEHTIARQHFELIYRSLFGR